MVFQSRPFAQSFIQKQSALAVQLHLAGQSKADSLERYSLIRGGSAGCNCKSYLLEILFGVQTKYAVGAEDKIEIAAVLIGINLTSQLARDEDSALVIDNVKIFAC
jgi:hypothetical protein